MAREHRPPWQLYKEEMDFLCLQSEALWEPVSADNKPIRIGDVGFIRRGQFHLLFHTGSSLGEVQLGDDVPSTFSPLTIGKTAFRDPRPPDCLHSGAVEAYGAGLGITVPTPLPLEPGVQFSFKLTGNHGAALRTRYPTYMEDARSETTFERYVKRHYESWVAFARDKECGDDARPILVSGFDVTKDFAMLAYSNKGISLEFGSEIDVAMFASASASITVTRHTECSPHLKCGPQPWGLPPTRRAIDFPSSPSADPRAIPSGFDQCVFIRYYTARLRKWMPPKVLRGGAGPHDLGSGDNRGGTFPELMTQSDADESTTSTDEDPGSQSDLATDNTDSDSIIVVRNTPYDRGYDSWDAIADYVFQNSNAVSVLMHHRDLAGIRTAGDTDDISTLLDRHRPRIVVDSDGVGRINHQAIQQPIPPHIMTGFEHQKSGDTTPNPESHSAATAALNPNVKVEQRVHSLDDTDPSEPNPTATTKTDESSPPAPAQSSRLDKSLGSIENVAHPALIGHAVAGGKVISHGDASSLLPSPRLDPTLHTERTLDPPAALYSRDQALQRLISRAVPQDELPSLIRAVFSGSQATNVVDSLQGSDAQTFIDVMDGALDHLDLTPRIRGKCMGSLYKMCVRHSLLPRSLQIGLCYDPAGVPHHRGGFADVWKGEHRGLEVAVKVLRTHTNSDLEVVTRRFCKEFVAWKALHHPNVLPLLGVIMTQDLFAMVSEWMPNGNINRFVMARWDANRFELLSDVARGLIYMHSQGMVHGDLKGANILVDQTCRARLGDFGLLAIISDTTTSSSRVRGGTTRWMSPEFFDPEIRGHCQTKNSDCYAFGMVIYEVLSGRVPFYQFAEPIVPGKVFRGERPEVPRGAEGAYFTDDVWEVLERCWTSQPANRPDVEDVLLCLEKVSGSWMPLSPRSLAAPSTEGSPTRGFSIFTAEGAGESWLSYPSSAAPSPPSKTLDMEEPVGIINSSASALLMKLSNWAGTSQDVSQVLTAAFEAEDYLDCIKDLQARNIEPLSYINSLDKIIDNLSIDSELQRRCVRALRKTCGLYGILPTSCEITFTPTKPPGQRAFASGGFADVWRVTDEKNTDLVFAVKSLRVYEQDPVEMINKKYCKGVILRKRANHPNVLSIEGVAPKLFEFCMVSQWMVNGNLMGYVTRYPGANRLELLIGITRGLDYLHGNDIVHGDLKSSNVLIDARGNPRLDDFGLFSITKNIDSVNASTPNRGLTVRYCAPELLNHIRGPGSKPTNKSDVYSLSMVITELATGKIPFPEYEDFKIPVLVLKGKRPLKPRSFAAPGMTPAVWKITKKCWNEIPKERPEADTVLRYLQDIAHKGSGIGVDEERSPSSLRQLWRDVFD